MKKQYEENKPQQLSPITQPPQRQRQLTYGQLRDVQDALRRPLSSGRGTVLIPLGPKAFVPGQLRPHHSSSKGDDDADDDLDDDDDDDGNIKKAADCTSSSGSTATTAASTSCSEGVVEEHVWFKNHLDGSLQQLTRQRALQQLQEEMNLLLLAQKKIAKPSQPQRAQKSILKSNKKTTTQSTTPATSTDNKRRQEQENASLLPFMEIREEYDETGQRLVWSEAIDVTKRLELLEQQQVDGGGGGGSGATTIGGSGSGAARDATGSGGGDDVPAAAAADDDDNDDNGSKRDDAALTEAASSSENHNDTKQQQQQQQQVSDQEYQALSSRLDELARLEEEAEMSNKINQTSAKKLQSKGWSKGFLNSTKKKAAVVDVVATRPSRPPVLNETASASPAAAAPVAVETVRDDTKKKVVGFHEETQVKEIPRVGERSIQDHIQKTKQQQPIPVVAPSRPLEESVFTGVVRERRPTSTAAARRARVGTTSKNSTSDAAAAAAAHTAATATLSSSSSSQPNKVSRFVQQRRQLG
jgi:hypothetical protein